MSIRTEKGQHRNRRFATCDCCGIMEETIEVKPDGWNRISTWENILGQADASGGNFRQFDYCEICSAKAVEHLKTLKPTVTA